MNMVELKDLLTIEPTPTVAWRTLPFEQIKTIRDQDQALARVGDIEPHLRKIVYTEPEPSVFGGGVRIVMTGSGPEEKRTQQVGVGSSFGWNVHLADFMAIRYVTKMTQDVEK